MTAMTDERVAVRYSELGPHRIAYSCAGDSGDPVLLVMGLTMRGDAWRHQIDDLAQHHRVAWFDHAGLGASGPVRSRRLRMADLAADAIGVLDSLGWERAHLVGLSMGGMIAQHIALDVPGRIATLSLLATHSGGCQPVLPPREAIKLLLASTVARDSERRLEVLAKLLLGSKFRETDPVRAAQLVRADFSHPPAIRTQIAQLHAIARHHTRDRLQELADIPTLIVRPGMDLLIDPRHSDLLHTGIPGSRIEHFPDAGHAITRECAPALNDLLLEHFARVQLQPTGSGVANETP